MTEAEWMRSSSSLSMVSFLGDNASKRKWRLFAFLCCRRLSDFLSDERSKEALEVAERFADGAASSRELDEAFTKAQAALDQIRSDPAEQRWYYACSRAAQAVSICCVGDRLLDPLNLYHLMGRAHLAHNYASGEDHSTTASREQRIQADWLRELFGNPFRHLTLTPSCHTVTVTSLAQAIYDERAFDRLPILADALEDAGCDNPDLLSHCRSGGEHVRGCWVVDLVLGKA